MTDFAVSSPAPARHAVRAATLAGPDDDPPVHVPVLQVISVDVQADVDDPSDAVLEIEIDDPAYGVLVGEMRLTTVKARRLMMQLQVQQQRVELEQHVLGGGVLDDFVPTSPSAEVSDGGAPPDLLDSGDGADDDANQPDLGERVEQFVNKRTDPAQLMSLFAGLMKESPAAQVVYVLIGGLLVLSAIVVIVKAFV